AGVGVEGEAPYCHRGRAEKSLSLDGHRSAREVARTYPEPDRNLLDRDLRIDADPGRVGADRVRRQQPGLPPDQEPEPRARVHDLHPLEANDVGLLGRGSRRPGAPGRNVPAPVVPLPQDQIRAVHANLGERDVTPEEATEIVSNGGAVRSQHDFAVGPSEAETIEPGSGEEVARDVGGTQGGAGPGVDLPKDQIDGPVSPAQSQDREDPRDDQRRCREQGESEAREAARQPPQSTVRRPGTETGPWSDPVPRASLTSASPREIFTLNRLGRITQAPLTGTS